MFTPDTTSAPEVIKKPMNKREAAITPDVMAWFQEHYDNDVLVEVKVKGNKLKPHQKAVLDKVSKGKFAYKFPDGRSRTPGDFISLRKAEAFTVVCDGRTCVATRTGEPKSFVIEL